jgi:hypothetical protein
VDQESRFSHEQVAVTGDVDVICGFRRGGLDRLDRPDAADHAQAIAGFQLASHRPADAHLPEALDAGDHDRVVDQLGRTPARGANGDFDPVRGHRLTAMHADYRAER